jgi:hypothetical protein
MNKKVEELNLLYKELARTYVFCYRRAISINCLSFKPNALFYALDVSQPSLITGRSSLSSLQTLRKIFCPGMDCICHV